METRKCTACHTDLPLSAFGIQTRKGKAPTYKYTCNVCLAKQKRQKSYKFSTERILTREAPLRAANQLLRLHPEALALLVQRFRNEYVPLLENERKRMIVSHERRCEINRANYHKKKKKVSSG